MKQLLIDASRKAQLVNGIWMIPQNEVKKVIIAAYNKGKLDSDNPQTASPLSENLTINGFTYTREEFERCRKQYEDQQ